jgi:hypothetical protein
LLVLLPVRDREFEPPREFLPRLAAGFRVLLLLRDAAGEDVRVAMVTNLRECHTSPTHHTVRVWNG